MSDTTINAEPLVGKVRTALNQSDSSIHDPEAARKLGFRGAAVGGNNHLDLFAPLLVEAYGREWFERGALSVYFQNVVVSGETVQAVVERPAPAGAQTRIHARRADDPAMVVCQGTASLGDHSRSDLRTRDLKIGDDANLRLLKGVKPGQLLGRLPLTAQQSFQDQLLKTGALNEVEGRVVGVGDSPKTEYLWWDAVARDETGETVVTMRHLLRFLKASSPLYAG